MQEIIINCENIEIDSFSAREVKVTLCNVDNDFIGDIEIDDIVSEVDNDKLFQLLIENDEEILHNYLEKNGYILNEA